MTRAEPPPKKVTAPLTNEAATTTLNRASQCTACGIDEPCVCGFYLDWEIWTSDPDEPVSVQLHRRRLASFRCGRTESGRRDPISASWW